MPKDKLFQFRLNQKERELLEDLANANHMKLGEYLRAVLTGSLPQPTIPRTPPMPQVDLGKLTDIEAQIRMMDSRHDKRLTEQSKLLETFTNIVLELREANRTMHENTTQAINLALQQNTNVITTLQTLHAQFEQLIKRIEELKAKKEGE